MDTNGEPINHNVSHAICEESLESWPSLIHASTSLLSQAEESNIRFMLWASFAEIYNEQIFDLLDSAPVSTARASRPTTLQLRDGDGRPYIRGLREVQVCSAEEAWRLVQIGRENQHISSTRLNRASSRSHSIFTLRLIQVVDIDQPSVARVASLSFCDLAGSERSTASGGCNERIKEAGNINLSLMTLGRCVEALRRNQARADQSTAARASTVVPFRNSKLTRMFQSFLCGEGRVVMITNVSPCANVFDETLHAVNYSALASQVVVGPSAPPPPHSTAILTVPAPADKRKVSFLGKHEAAAATSKVVLEKKRKCDDTIQEAEDEDLYSSDEDAPDTWMEDRQKLLTLIKKLRDELVEKQKSMIAIRAEVCEEMQRQLVRIENEYQESARRHEENLEEKYDRKMEIYMEAVQKSCKRQRRGDDEEDSVPSVELHAAEVKISKYAEEIQELKSKISEMSKELAAARENVSKLSAERDAVAEKLTKAEFSASDAVRQEKTQARIECTKLRKTVEELTNKLSETEHRNEISCRQLRRDKAQLEQRLKAAEAQAADHDPLQSASTLDDEVDKNSLKSQTAKITELEAALKKEREAVHDLELRLKSAEDDTKAVEKTWAEHCKGVEAVCQEKSYELTKLREKYEVLEQNMQEEAKQQDAQIEETLRTARNDLQDKEMQLKEVTAALESLRAEIDSLKVESGNVRKDLSAKEDECEKLKMEIEDLKQQISAAAGNSQDEVSAIQHDLEATREKLKQVEDDKVATVDLLNSEIENRTAQLVEGKDKLSDKVSEILRLEKELEVEKCSRRQLEEGVVADYEKKLDKLNSKLCQEKEKCSTLKSSFESLQVELDIVKNAHKSAEDEIAGHLSSKVAHEAKMERAKEELHVMREQLQKCDDCEKTLQKQLSSSSQLVNELQEKSESVAVQLADREKELQTCQNTMSELMKKSEEERLKFELALKDAHSNNEVVEQMKLTMTEQEMTMQAQDQMLRERDDQVRSLEENLEQTTADHRHQLKSLNDQIRQKNTRVRELDKEVEKMRKSRECLEKDVRDTTSELKTSESDLAEVRKDLAHTKRELEKLKSDEKSSAKQLCLREMESSNLRKQLEAAQDRLDKRDQEMKMLNVQFHALKADKENELSKWREEHERKEAEIQHLKAAEERKAGSSRRSKHPSSESQDRKVEALQKKVEQLTRAALVKEQTISDMMEQNLQLQHQLCQLQHPTDVDDAEDNHRRRNAPRKSRIPTSQRVPLRATDGNADISVGVLADGGIAVDLDETVGASRRCTRRCHISHENSQPKSDTVEEQYTRGTRGRRQRTTGVMDTNESTITEEPDGPPQRRRLRSRHC